MRVFRDLSFTIIGNGALGGALVDFLKNKSYPIRSIFDSRCGLTNNPDGSSTKSEHRHPHEESDAGDVIFICVPDDHISKIAYKLSCSNIKWESKKVIHCSGNFFSNELEALADLGAQTASMHPLQTFQRGDNADRFKGIYVSLEGHVELCEDLEEFVELMEAKSIQVQKEQKQILHIAAVFASNYVVSVLHEAESLLKKHGIENGLETLEPLIRQTIKNSLDLGPTDALSGPVARGDSESVLKHLKALEGETETKGLYRILGIKALQIAKIRGSVSEDKLSVLEQILQSER